MNPTFLEEFVKAITLVLSDYPKKPVDALLFFSRSYGDSPAVTKLVSDLILDGTAKFIFLADQDGEKWKEKEKYTANPGKNYYINELIKSGIKKDKIIICPRVDEDIPGLNTKLEGQALIKEVRKRNLTSGVVVAYPHQLIRISLGLIKDLTDQKYYFNFWHAFPKYTDWDEKTEGSQGMNSMPRKDHIKEELKRIITYQPKGDLVTFKEFFEYMEKRKEI